MRIKLVKHEKCLLSLYTVSTQKMLAAIVAAAIIIIATLR